MYNLRTFFKKHISKKKNKRTSELLYATHLKAKSICFFWYDNVTLKNNIHTALGYVAIFPTCGVVLSVAPRSLFFSLVVSAVVFVGHQTPIAVLVRGLGVPSLTPFPRSCSAHAPGILVPNLRSRAFVVFC